MKFEVSPKVFDVLPNAVFGVVMVEGADNTAKYPGIEELLAVAVAGCEANFDGANIKESPEIAPYREAFRTLGINPNKYMCSIEALISRIAKKKGMPSINPLVDLGNAVSIKYRLPIGAHDADTLCGPLEVRFSNPDDSFIPFGGGETEMPDENELVYVSGGAVRTRRWTWRQSEIGKITGDTSSLIFPIDGFADLNAGGIVAARDELANLVREFFGCKVTTGLVDKNSTSFSYTPAD